MPSTRSVLTDGGDVLLGLAVGGANRRDYKMARQPIERLPVARPEPTPPLGMRLDKGDDEVRELLTEFTFTAHLRTLGEEAKVLNQKAGFKARRWTVSAFVLCLQYL
jgi:putative transposase